MCRLERCTAGCLDLPQLLRRCRNNWLMGPAVMAKPIPPPTKPGWERASTRSTSGGSGASRCTEPFSICAGIVMGSDIGTTRDDPTATIPLSPRKNRGRTRHCPCALAPGVETTRGMPRSVTAFRARGAAHLRDQARDSERTRRISLPGHRTIRRSRIVAAVQQTPMPPIGTIRDSLIVALSRIPAAIVATLWRQFV